MHTIIAENELELSKELGKIIEKASNESITDHGAFYIGVSGGSLITFLSNAIPAIKTDLSKWTIVFNDERVVPLDDEDSTFGAYKKNIIGKVALREDQFVQMKQGVSADDAAVDYVQKMSLIFGGDLPKFDMLLLGMGPDGHTCSLFPGHKLLSEESMWFAPIYDSPKPPLARITITFPVINNAKYCVFAMSGEGKAEMLKRVLVNKEDFPVNMVKPKSGEVWWIVDKAAGKYLKN
ncbi:hypothetical protein FQR65_LT04865 [Abscondita terminalis]|nr:hypothetical protein FQR65_LT04865 [Abscondita terminalis]